jgi:catechol 2,3-dioxygenase
MGSSTTHFATDTSEIGIHAPEYRLPASAHIGRVRLAISDLKRSVNFYREVIGLAVLDAPTAETRVARLGAHGGGRVLLELEEIPGVQGIGRRTRLGLYHTAFLLPSREAFSSFVRNLVRRGTYFGSADHLVSEALYLTDPDGLQVEVYADRPREQWSYEGREIVMATEPLRFDELPAVDENSWKGAPAGTSVGHVHMYVGDLEAAAKFYHAALGLDITTRRYPGALFTSAGGYHHHMGLNVWAASSPPASQRDARLLFWELVLPNEAEVERVKASLAKAGYLAVTTATGTPAFSDPWGITVALVSGA